MKNKKKILNNLQFWILFLAIGLWCKRKVHTNFKKKKFIFKVLVIFWKWKLCCTCAGRAHGKIRRFFGIELIKIKPIDSNVPVFENRKKVKITPPYSSACLLFIVSTIVAQNCNPEIGRHGHRDAHGLSGTDPRLKLRISIRTMPKDVDTHEAIHVCVCMLRFLSFKPRPDCRTWINGANIQATRV